MVLTWPGEQNGKSPDLVLYKNKSVYFNLRTLTQETPPIESGVGYVLNINEWEPTTTCKIKVLTFPPLFLEQGLNY